MLVYQVVVTKAWSLFPGIVKVLQCTVATQCICPAANIKAEAFVAQGMAPPKEHVRGKRKKQTLNIHVPCKLLRCGIAKKEPPVPFQQNLLDRFDTPSI